MLKQIYHTALSAAEKAADTILKAHLLPKKTEFKGRTDLVTETDKKSENIIPFLSDYFLFEWLY